ICDHYDPWCGGSLASLAATWLFSCLCILFSLIGAGGSALVRRRSAWSRRATTSACATARLRARTPSLQTLCSLRTSTPASTCLEKEASRVRLALTQLRCFSCALFL